MASIITWKIDGLDPGFFRRWGDLHQPTLEKRVPDDGKRTLDWDRSVSNGAGRGADLGDLLFDEKENLDCIWQPLLMVQILATNQYEFQRDPFV